MMHLFDNLDSIKPEGKAAVFPALFTSPYGDYPNPTHVFKVSLISFYSTVHKLKGNTI